MRKSVVALLLAYVGVGLGGRSAAAVEGSRDSAAIVDVVVISAAGDVDEELAEKMSGNRSDVARTIRDQVEKGSISIVDRFQLSATTNGPKAFFQRGQMVAVATARARMSPRGQTTRTFQNQNVGTIASATVREAGDTLEIQLEVERSELQPAAEMEDGGELIPPSTTTLSSQLVVRLEDGESKLAGRHYSVSQGNARTELIVVSARLQNGQPQQRENLRVFSLKNASASSVSEVINRLLAVSRSRAFNIAVDERTNSLLLLADNETAREIEAIVQYLDARDTARRETPQNESRERRALDAASETATGNSVQ